jgi:holin-like protein
MLRTYLVLLGCQAAGDVIHQVSGIPLSGPIIGMILLLAALTVRGGASDEFCGSAQTTLGYLSLFLCHRALASCSTCRYCAPTGCHSCWH